MLRFIQRNKGRLLKTKPVFQTLSRAYSAAWEDEWKQVVGDLYYHEDFNKSADQLRAIIKSEMLKFTDLRDNPERFFAAHRTLAERSTELGPGFWIRFTVQYNLFAGTILGLGGDEQLKMLETRYDGGNLSDRDATPSPVAPCSTRRQRGFCIFAYCSALFRKNSTINFKQI